MAVRNKNEVRCNERAAELSGAELRRAAVALPASRSATASATFNPLATHVEQHNDASREK